MYHKITVKPAHLMANNEMHDDGDGIIFCLGKTYNFWKGEEVIKIDAKFLNLLTDCSINEDEQFYIKDGIPHLETFMV